jgi:hypothetical protein
MNKKEANCMYIHDICILPEYRGNNLINIFLEKINIQTKLEGYKHQSLTAISGKEKFWENKGFENKKRITFCNNHMAMLMEKKLVSKL